MYVFQAPEQGLFHMSYFCSKLLHTDMHTVTQSVNKSGIAFPYE